MGLAGRRVEQPSGHRHDALVDDLALRILVLVDQVLRQRLGGEPVGMRLHPARDERRQVQCGVAVEVELVVDQLPRALCGHPLGRKPVFGDLVREGAIGVGRKEELLVVIGDRAHFSEGNLRSARPERPHGDRRE